MSQSASQKQPHTTAIRLRKFPLEYLHGIGVTIVVIFLPIILPMFLNGCSRYVSQNSNVACYDYPLWINYYFLGMIILFVILYFTNHLVTPWSPVLVATTSVLKYRRYQYFISLPALDKFLWYSVPLDKIKEAQLFIRVEDKDKEGLKVGKMPEEHEGYRKFHKNMSFEEYWTYQITRDKIGDFGLDPLYKNQNLLLLGDDKAVLAEIPLTFVYEEDLQQINGYFKSKRIPFSVKYTHMPDEVKERYGNRYTKH